LLGISERFNINYLGRSMRRKKGLEEQMIQKFSYRCPYCEQPVSYDQMDLRAGENEIKCPSCKKEYIKVVFNGSPSSSAGKGGRRRAPVSKAR
jgi:ribosomal protein L37AE/L43A